MIYVYKAFVVKVSVKIFLLRVAWNLQTSSCFPPKNMREH